jgi:2-polyprenyl-6-methoxyphenol hydroxylase-like FAD-dependent oxidoreductase
VTVPSETEVLIVGAGPTGLMLANWLRTLGIDSVLVDAKSGPTIESRALGVQARSMEIYDQLGLADRVLDDSTRADVVAPGYRAHTFSRMSLLTLGQGVSRYPHVYTFEQNKNERLLVDHLESMGGAVSWSHRLLDLTIHAGDPLPVDARLDDATGAVQIRARFCVAADGSSSMVRKHLGIPFDGSTHGYTFFVNDAVGVRGLTRDALNLRLAAKEFLLGFPMGSDDARLIGMVKEGELAEAESLQQSVRRRLSEVYAVEFDSSRWFSTYRVHHRVARDFRRGPVFLVGDAAHVHSPLGGQGMNTGLQDAHNLAMKLADVIHGRASDAHLDRYAKERQPVARRLIAATEAGFGAVTSASRRAEFVRRRVVPIAMPVLARILPRIPLAHRVFGYISQTRIHYWMTDDAQQSSKGRRGTIVGRRLPCADGNVTALREAFWQVHSYGGVEPAELDSVAAQFGARAKSFSTTARTLLKPRMLYLIRPDGFVAAEAPPAAAATEFSRVLRAQCFIEPEPGRFNLAVRRLAEKSLSIHEDP